MFAVAQQSLVITDFVYESIVVEWVVGCHGDISGLRAELERC